MHCMWHPPRCTVGSKHPGPRARGATEGLSLQQVHVTLAEWLHLCRALADDYLSFGLVCVSPFPSALLNSSPSYPSPASLVSSELYRVDMLQLALKC